MNSKNKINDIFNYESVCMDKIENKLVILDQTKLPNEIVFLCLSNIQDIWEAIYHLKVRGAPAIGIAAAIGIAVVADNFDAESYDEFYNEFKKAKDYLASSRPTAVNLFWALDRMEQAVVQNKSKSIEEIKGILKETAQEIKDEDIWVCKQIGEHGLKLIQDGWGILTHCNAGHLATARYGTALAPIYLGQERGYKFKVFTDETRPLLQGARLSAFELHSAGINTTLICDNMVSIVMKKGLIQAVFVGCDRVAANGDSANKIGTSGVAILAKHYGIPFYVCAPTSTIDMKCESGEFIKIEERSPKEITEMWYNKPMAPEGIKVYNPAFDVTDANLITAIITEWGIAKPPYTESFKEIFDKKGKNTKWG